ncbi:hypothetical protein AMS68_006015 [Peltaster fructicola]|uniref:MARVEL domain-containing protein n=1 Tax=Peltaster fructicola TaxID=286661 RepID=A0A6H0Y0Y0_9PEZI|nr:hypothetical protein AMS68_006015 [Peltaster fructicola]
MSEAKKKPAPLKLAMFKQEKAETATPRTPRFAEATAVYSPIDQPSRHYVPQQQVADVGFGYVNKHESVEMPSDSDSETYTIPKSPLKSPLKSAMKMPGAPPRDLKEGVLSPTFREEDLKSPTHKEEAILDKHEISTDKQQAADLKVKTRVRIAKFFLRGVNFSCALIILSMLGTTFSIFNATKALPARNNLPPWAANQQLWPQILLLCLACVSMFTCLIVFYGYYKGGHNRAQKAGVYYATFAVCFFIFSIVMWLVGLILLHQSRANGNNKDLWGWSCVDNTRKQLFQNDVKYDLICRLQNWSLVCAIIEIVVEVLTIAVYAIVFYRFWSKRKLRKSMAVRDRARSDLYLAQLRSQSAPNTPGFGPLSPRDGGYRPPNLASYVNGPDIEKGMVQYVDPDAKVQPTTFQLQAPPSKATPKMQAIGFTPIEGPPKPYRPTPAPIITAVSAQTGPLSPAIMSPREKRQEHFEAAPGEPVYEQVAIPGAYMSPTAAQFPK